MSRAAAAAPCPVCEAHAESVFRIEGMDCHEEVAILERRLGNMPGLESLSADVVAQRLRVSYDAARLTVEDLTEAVSSTGMRAWLDHERPHAAHRATSPARVILVGASGASLAAGLAWQAIDHGSPWPLVFYVATVLTGGIHTVRRALAAARSRSLDINVLMLLAVCGAMVIHEWTEAAAVVFLFALAQLIETRSMDRARHAIRALMELAPPEALVRRGAGEQRIDVELIQPGDIVIIKPGERIPLDGVVVEGTSEVNQAPITGESRPAEKSPGSDVFAGTINGHGALDVRVTKLRRDTAMARIINLVELAQAQRAPSQSFVERFARYYTPAVIAGAVVVSVVPPALFGQPVAPWLYRALVLLVISCPCALVISTPVSIVSALAGAARAGVLVKGGVHLERTARVRAVAFDKTGTLTDGRLEVADVVPLNGVTSDEVLALAAAVEARSEHPVAEAILRRAREAGVPVSAGEAFQALPGLGAEARLDGRSLLAGSHRLFEERGICSREIDSRLEQIASQGWSAILVARDNLPLGIVALADTTRAGGRQAIEALRRHGVACVVMLTGDNAQTAGAIARALGIDEFHAELLPADKVEAVRLLRERYGAVAMVGDGVNDAPALAVADVGIAMGAAGSDAALETADVALMADDLQRVPYLLRLGRATLGNIQANITFALGLKAVFLALAVGGVATLWMAVVADMGASLLVIGNGLRLLRAR